MWTYLVVLWQNDRLGDGVDDGGEALVGGVQVTAGEEENVVVGHDTLLVCLLVTISAQNCCTFLLCQFDGLICHCTIGDDDRGLLGLEHEVRVPHYLGGHHGAVCRIFSEYLYRLLNLH